MFDRMKNYKLLAVLALCATLAGCLPEDTNVQDKLVGSKHTDQSGSYGMALGGVAMRIQNAILRDASWFDSLGAGQELNLATLGITVDNMPAEVKALACPDTDGKVLQMVWLHGSDSEGKFKIDRIGFDKANMIDALKKRIATSQLGMKLDGNRVGMMDGSTLNIPEGCVGLQSIPKETPVIAIEITRPAAPTTQMSRTEYRTVECPSGQTGSKIQRRNIMHKPDGSFVISNGLLGEVQLSPEAGWQDVDIGKCRTMVEVGVEIDDTRIGGAGSALDDFAALNLRGILDQRVRDITCSNTTVSKDGKNKDIDTCGNATQLTANQQVTEAAQADGFEERIIQCVGSYTVVKAPTFGGVSGNCDVSSDWSGTATLIRTRVNSNVSAGTTAKQVGIENWLGKATAGVTPSPVMCDSDENTVVNCNQLTARPTAVQDPTKWLTISLDSARTHTGDCFAGNCFTVTPVTFTYLNRNYFTGSSLVENGGITVNNTAYARDWENRETFKTKITSRDNYRITRNQCEWHNRTMYEQCPLDTTVTVAGSFNSSLAVTTTPYATYSNTPPTLTFYDGYTGSTLNTTNINAALPISASGAAHTFISTYLNQVVGFYNQYRAAGHVVIGSARNFTRTVSTSVPYYGQSCWNDCFLSFCNWVCQDYVAGYNTVNTNYGGHTTLSQANNLYYESWQTGSPVSFNYVLNNTAMNLRNAMCAAGHASGAYASLCTADHKMTTARINLTRELCRMPSSTGGNELWYSPGVSGALANYCNYVFDEYIWDSGNWRTYAYTMREMADSTQRYTNTTVMNRDGVISRLKPVMLSSPNRIGMEVVGFVSPLQCARQEQDLVEVPLRVRNRINFNTFDCKIPSYRSSSWIDTDWRCGGFLCMFNMCSTYVNQNTTAVLRRLTVREYRSDIGWSTPRYQYYSPYYGTFSSLPSSIFLDIPNHRVGDNCHSRDAECDAQNSAHAFRR